MEKELPIYEEKYWDSGFDQIANEFITNKDIMKIFFWVTEEGMQSSFTQPPVLQDGVSFDSDFEYFVKIQPEVRSDNVE